MNAPTPQDLAWYFEGLEEAIRALERVRARGPGHALEVPTLAAGIEAVTEQLAIEELRFGRRRWQMTRPPAAQAARPVALAPDGTAPPPTGAGYVTDPDVGMRPEYDVTGGERGKYHAAYVQPVPTTGNPPTDADVEAVDLDQVALDVLQEVTTALYSVTMPITQRHAKAQNAIRAALAALRARRGSAVD